MDNLGKKAAGAMAWNFVGKVYFTIVKYAESIVLLRLLGADEYGAMGAVLNVQALAVMFISLGLNNTVLKFLPKVREDGGDERRFLNRVVLLRFAMSVVTGIVLVAGSRFFAAHFAHDAARGNLFFAAGLLVIGTSLQTLLMRILVSRYKQKELNLIQSGVITAYLAIAVLVLLLGGGVFAVLLVNGVTTAASCLILLVYTQTKAKEIESAKRPATVPLRRLISFSITFYLYDILNFILDKSLDVMLISLLCKDLKQVAYYLLAYNFAINSLSIFTKVFAEGFTLSMVADVYATGNRERLQKIFDAIFQYIYLFAVPIAVGGLILGGDIIRFMYGREGYGAASPAVFFLVIMALGKYQGLTANFLGAMDKERALIVSRAIFAALNLILDLVLIPRYGAWGAVIGTSIATLSGLVYETVLLHIVLKPKYPWMFLAKTVGASLAMAGAVLLLGRVLPDSEKIRVLVALPAGGIVYAAGLLLMKPISPFLVDLIGQLNAPGAKWFAKFLRP